VVCFDDASESSTNAGAPSAGSGSKIQAPGVGFEPAIPLVLPLHVPTSLLLAQENRNKPVIVWLTEIRIILHLSEQRDRKSDSACLRTASHARPGERKQGKARKKGNQNALSRSTGERCNEDSGWRFYLVEGDGFSVLGLYLPFVASIFRSSWFSRAISLMSFALGLLAVPMLNPLLNFLDTLGFHVPNKIICVRETFNSHLRTILSEE